MGLILTFNQTSLSFHLLKLTRCPEKIAPPKVSLGESPAWLAYGYQQETILQSDVAQRWWFRVCWFLCKSRVNQDETRYPELSNIRITCTNKGRTQRKCGLQLSSKWLDPHLNSVGDSSPPTNCGVIPTTKDHSPTSPAG